jgi:hypothetical protein
MDFASPLSTDTRARVGSPRSPAFHRERRRAATAAAPPRRSLGFPVVHRARAPSQHSSGHLGPARPAPPRR